MTPAPKNDGSSGSGCVILIAIIVAFSVAAYFALVQNADFIGAKTIRTLASEATESYEYAKRQFESFANNVTNPQILVPAAPTDPRGTNDHIVFPSTVLRDTADERQEVPNPAMRHHELKSLLLQLTNQHRANAGVPPVKMGNNPAAQLHAEAALEGCYSSHWDRWGLKPNHRYTLTGGTGADAENVSGLDYCIKPEDNFTAHSSMELEVIEAIESWTDSPGHRRNSLDPAHNELNVGIAYDRYNTVMAQHFTSDYVRYDRRPAIDPQGILTLSATVSGATLQIRDSVNIQIAYDSPPKTLTKGQLSYTYALCLSTPVAYVVEPLPPGWHFNESGVNTTTHKDSCVDPYLTPAGHPAPDNPDEAHRMWEDAKSASANAPALHVQTIRIVSKSMTVNDTDIEVQADLSKVLATHGPGIYTVILWGKPHHMAKPVPLSKQAIFWKTQPPAGAPY